MKLLRSLVAAALALTMVIIATSAFIRLSQAALPLGESPLANARLLHRFAASAAGILVVLVAVLGWGRWQGTLQRAASVGALALVVVLAWLGKYSSAAIPAVALANLVGGMVLFGLLACLWQPRAPGTAFAASPDLRFWTAMGLLAVLLEIVLGGLLAVRDAAFAFQAAHGLGALAVALVLSWLFWGQLRRGNKALAIAMLSFTGVVLVLGAAMLFTEVPVPLTLLHNGASALILAMLSNLLCRLHAKWP